MKKTIKISPIKRMPFNRHYFDYSIPENLKGSLQTGQLVKIPLRNKEEYGVVIGFEEKTLPDLVLKKLKPVNDIIFKQPAFTNNYLNFLKEISELYYVSFNFLLKTALPPIKKRKLSKENIEEIKIKEEKIKKPEAVFLKNKSETIDYLKNNIDSKNQNLILVPTVERINFWKNILEDLFKKENILTIGGTETEKDNFEKWFRVRNNPNLLVIATRRALFYPWINLKNIFMLNEGSFDYKSWDMAPRIQTRDASMVLAKYTGANIHLMSQGHPSVETYFFTKNKIYNCEKNKLHPPENQPWITDTTTEKQAGNFTEISRLLETEIDQEKKGDIFLFLNRRGENHNLYCRECKKTIVCPDCETSLSSLDKKTTACLKCQKKFPTYSNCPYCKSEKIIWIGLGIKGIKKLLEKKFSDRYDIFAWEKDDLEIKDTKKEKIIIGTKFAFSRLKWDEIKLVAFLDTDASLYIPEFKAMEELWQTIYEVSEKSSPQTKIILQTGNPEHPLIASLPSPDKFYINELTERKILNYPPYTFLEKIFFSDKIRENVEKQAKNMENKLKILTKAPKNAIIMNPVIIPPEKGNNLYSAVILVKIPYANYKTILREISTILEEGWKTDPNPNQLFNR